jgi:hypothetical protein
VDPLRTDDAGPVADARDLDWDGCFNVRDLGGLAAAGGRRTRWGAVVRSDGVSRLTAAGWSAVQAHGIETVVDLRNDDEIGQDTAPRPAGLTTVRVPLDDRADTRLWTYLARNRLEGSPLYYRPFMESKADRCAAVISAIGRAAPGGVLVHCRVGRDRTGLISVLLLALAGVGPGDIAADYEISTQRMAGLSAAVGDPDPGPMIRDILAGKGTTVRDAVLDTLAWLDVEALLASGGLSAADMAAVRDRLLEPGGPRPAAG